MELSETQARILEILQEDARTSMRSLAERVGVSTPTISSTVKELEDLGVVKRYSVLLDTHKLGLYTFYLRVEVDLTLLDSIGYKISSLNEVRNLKELDGGTLFVEIIVPSLDVLDNIVKDLKRIEGIKGLKLSRVTREIKSTNTIPLESITELSIDCFYCKKNIVGTPIKFELDDKKHYVCCDVCAAEYKEKYGRMKKKSDIDS